MPQLVLDENGALDLATIYNPYPKQSELHESLATNLLAIGGNGSGKSAFLLGEAIYTCFEYPGADCLLLRRDFKELDKGLILDFKNTVPKELYRYNDQKHVVTFPMVNGVADSHIFFGYLLNGSERTLSQYLSSAFVFIGVDELGQFSYAAYSFLGSRNRVNKGCTQNMFGQWPVPRMGAATNPRGAGYAWIKQLWIEKKPISQMGQVEKGKGRDKKFYGDERGKRVVIYDPDEYHYVHSTVLDNPAQLEKDPQYIDKLQKLPEPLRSQALEGDLNALPGSYFANFSYERNVRQLPRDREELELEPWQPIWLGFDWGLAHHTAVFWYTRGKVKALDGKWKSCVVTLREMIVNEQDYQVDKEKRLRRGDLPDDWNYKRYLCQEIFRRTPGPPENTRPEEDTKSERARLKYIFLSPERFDRVDETSHTVAAEMSDILKRLGLPRCSEANDARVDGAVMMYNLIDSGEWVILETCQVLITAIQTRVRDEIKLEDVQKTDDELDDAYDGSRYGLLSMLKEKGKPEEVKLQEKLATIEDPIARIIYAYKHKMEQEGKDQPIKTRIVPRWQKPNG